MSEQDRSVERNDYGAFCRRYNLDPDDPQSRREWDRARRALADLERAAARQEARQAISKAQEGNG